MTPIDSRDPPLEATGLDVSLGGRPILHGVDLELRAGEMLAVIGPNGAGKSTLLRALAGIVSPRAGRIALGGEPLEGMPRRTIARRLAYLPQETSAEFGLLVKEVVSLGRVPHAGWMRPLDREDLAATRSAMELADVAHLADRRVTTLSGGERRRVLLARAIAQGSPVLVLDEPIAALDVGHACGVMRKLRELADAGATIVIALHELTFAVREPDRALLLNEGRVVDEGPPAQVVSGGAARSAYGVALHVVDDPPGVVPERAT